MMYMICYPRGDKTKLAIAHVVDGEKRDWALASKRSYDYTDNGLKEAQEYMKELAEKHGLEYENDDFFLD